jgi:hypothetical protein
MGEQRERGFFFGFNKKKKAKQTEAYPLKNATAAPQ